VRPCGRVDARLGGATIWAVCSALLAPPYWAMWDALLRSGSQTDGVGGSTSLHSPFWTLAGENVSTLSGFGFLPSAAGTRAGQRTGGRGSPMPESRAICTASDRSAACSFVSTVEMLFRMVFSETPS